MKFSEVKTISVDYEIAGFNAVVAILQLGEFAALKIEFFDEKGEVKLVRDLHLDGEAYANWGTDDNYINQYIEANLDKIL